MVRNFTLQEVTITLQDNADETPVYFNMPFNHTIDYVHLKICCHTNNEKMQMSVMLTQLAALAPLGAFRVGEGRVPKICLQTHF
jgi:hypothetical protein